MITPIKLSNQDRLNPTAKGLFVHKGLLVQAITIRNQDANGHGLTPEVQGGLYHRRSVVFEGITTYFSPCKLLMGMFKGEYSYSILLFTIKFDK